MSDAKRRLGAAGDEVVDAAASASVAVQQHPAYRWLVTVGLWVYGLVHLLLAWLTLQVLLGHKVSASNQGSIAAIAKLPMGHLIIVAVIVGMFALTVWMLIEGLFGFTWLDGSKLVFRKVACFFRAVVYASIGIAGITVLTSGSAGSGSSSAHRTSASLLGMPGGRVWVALIGLGIAIAAGDQIQRGIRTSFVKYDLQGRPPRWAVQLGVVGWTTKGLALAIVAILFWVAAYQHNSKKAGGLDQALEALKGTPIGVPLLALIALGFVCFGIFCFVWSRYARHDAREPEGSID
ncbi:MAG TPA: DUF1206 domain-containing protein [Propionibacteriaceae bacterium]|nr:DUF1206 domain-containing protein [Propionibacteriaceae bacterium]